MAKDMASMPKPPFGRWVVSILAAAAASPFASPMFLGWMFVVWDGSDTIAEFSGGILSGAMFALVVSWQPVLVAVIVLCLVVYVKWPFWARAHWMIWLMLGGAIGVGTLAMRYGPVDLLPVALITALPAGAIAALIFRWVLLSGTPKAPG